MSMALLSLLLFYGSLMLQKSHGQPDIFLYLYIEWLKKGNGNYGEL